MREIVSRAFAKSKEQVGYIDPTIVSEEIFSYSQHLPPYTRQRIHEIVRFYPTSDFVYPDVLDFIPRVLTNPTNKVRTWTDDYLDRVASSGIGNLRRTLTYDQRRRFGVLSDRQDKITALAEEFESEEGNTRFVLVDDREANLHKAFDIARDVGVSDRCEFVFLNRRNTAPLNGFVHTTSFSEYGFGREFENTDFLIDFNGVCIDDKGYQEEREQIVAREVDIFIASERSE